VKPTLLYDGDCGFCTVTAARMQRWGRGRYGVVAWQRADLVRLGVTPELAASAVQWVDRGRVLSGAEAFSAALVAAGGFWRPIGWMLSLPGVRVLARRTYELVARHRHRLPGSTDACRTDG
jgi:predicted DCC family thiol-disulfide oxidoreductase YuxK